MTPTCLISPEQLLELIESTWIAMVGLPISLADTADAPDDQEAKPITAFVQITGRWRGTVLFQPSTGAAKRAASLMLGVPEAELGSSDIHDTVAELCNILGGGIKSLLPGPSSLSLPMVMHGSSYGFSMPLTRRIAQVRYAVEGQPVDISVLEETETLTAPYRGL